MLVLGHLLRPLSHWGSSLPYLVFEYSHHKCHILFQCLFIIIMCFCPIFYRYNIINYWFGVFYHIHWICSTVVDLLTGKGGCCFQSFAMILLHNDSTYNDRPVWRLRQKPNVPVLWTQMLARTLLLGLCRLQV